MLSKKLKNIIFDALLFVVYWQMSAGAFKCTYIILYIWMEHSKYLSVIEELTVVTKVVTLDNEARYQNKLWQISEITLQTFICYFSKVSIVSSL